MGRIRTIKPETPQSESLGRVSRDSRLLFVLLWTICDDEGRTRAASRLLASLLFPYDEDAPALIDGWLEELEVTGHLNRYTVDGSMYLQITNWPTHQKIDRPSVSKLPSPRDNSRPLANPREDSATDLDLDLDREVDLDRDRGHGPVARARERASVEPRWGTGGRPRGLVDGPAPRHGAHAWCSLPREGLCVPRFLHDEFLGKSGKPDTELKAWYAATLQRFAGVAIGDDGLRFWRNEFAAWVGTVTVSPADTREGRTIAAGNRLLAEIGTAPVPDGGGRR